MSCPQKPVAGNRPAAGTAWLQTGSPDLALAGSAASGPAEVLVLPRFTGLDWGARAHFHPVSLACVRPFFGTLGLLPFPVGLP